ncbi:hypothetical protein GYMLUDRAFT_35890 [Collybiopsis luxurians FD-317 M1]|nr:hypothetical protein GYMLUDRAFT_35890 [Collybiopsis luxurians FD-317 M1]
MKQFFVNTFSILAISATSVLSQSAFIGAPADMTKVAAGSNFTAMIERPDSLTASSEVALVIGLLSCGSAPCPTPAQTLGTVLYNGPFDPEFRTVPGTPNLPPYQNFTLTVPSNFAKGNAQLGVVHVALVGLSETPLFETLNTTIVIT